MWPLDFQYVFYVRLGGQYCNFASILHNCLKNCEGPDLDFETYTAQLAYGFFFFVVYYAVEIVIFVYCYGHILIAIRRQAMVISTCCQTSLFFCIVFLKPLSRKRLIPVMTRMNAVLTTVKVCTRMIINNNCVKFVCDRME